ncbi:MAG: hypothetical protein GY805_39835, partial [Chloroflexi bacterium]|nr:hypothetical protein [Chloroflexota bacterium]
TTQAKRDAEATYTAISVATANSVKATRQTFEIQQAQAEARREQITTIATSIFLGIAGIAAAVLLVLFFWKVIPVLINRLGLVRYGQHGNPLLLTDKNGRTIITDPMRMHQAAITISEEGQVMMPELTPNELQTLVTGGALRTLIEQVRNAPGHPPMLPRQSIRERQLGPFSSSETIQYPPAIQTHLNGSPVSQEDVLSPEERLLPLPASVTWNSLHGHAGNGLVLGMGQSGIVSIDLTQTPHILLSGSSGAGKTRRALRPLVAQALAQDMVVVLLNESAADFSPFYDHPNAFIIHGNAMTYVSFLQSAIKEVKRREMILRQARISEWRRLPDSLQDGPSVLIVIDEVLSLAMLMSPREQKVFWSLLATYASRARKLSMGSIGALTDPTYRILGTGLNWREQCNARISFRVAKANVSRAVLDANGAETLAEGQFLAMLGYPDLVRGVSANPGDAELAAYLAQHPKQPTTRQEWLLVPEPAEPLEPVQTSSERPEPPLHSEPEPVLTPSIPFSHDRPPTVIECDYIRQLAADGMSKNQICRHVYGFKNGKIFAWVTEAIEMKHANHRSETA